MSPLKSSWTSWLFYRRASDPSAAPLLNPSEGHPARPSYLGFSSSAVGAHGLRDEDLTPSYEGERDDVTVLFGAPNASQSQTHPHSRSDLSVSASNSKRALAALLPSPALQLNPGAPRSVDTKRIKRFLMQDIDGSRAAGPLTAYCFMTGFVDVICYSAIYVWCAFQTGNSLQLSLAVVRLCHDWRDFALSITECQALCSVICFIFGAFFGRLGDALGCKTRLWMSLGTFMQTLFTLAAAVAIWMSGEGSIASARADPAWSSGLAFIAVGCMSASMGLQGIMGKRMNTHFTTTVVLTTTWCELVTEPYLFYFNQLVISRDHKIMAIVSLFIGALSGRAILDNIGSAGALGVGTAMRFIITLWWFFIPENKTFED